MMVRDRTYRQLVESLTGKKVAVWTCNTCARFCGVGGAEAASRLANALSGDGVDAYYAGSTSASCFEGKVAEKLDLSKDPDVIISLTCDMGALCVMRVALREVVNPIMTLGPGFMTVDGVPVVCLPDGSGFADLDSEAERLGMFRTPFA